MTDCRHSLAGKLALVTGAGRCIGEANAIAYAAAGAHVACTARTASQVEKTARSRQVDETD